MSDSGSDSDIDELFERVSQLYEASLGDDMEKNSIATTQASLHVSQCDSENYELLLSASLEYEKAAEAGTSRYGSPQSSKQVEAIRKAGVPVKTRKQNSWAANVWRDWARYRVSVKAIEKKSGSMSFWMTSASYHLQQ